jgi:hypothetical protein
VLLEDEYTLVEQGKADTGGQSRHATADYDRIVRVAAL